MPTRTAINDGRGQTLVEAIIAIGIIVTSVASALTLVSTSINAEKESEAAIVAGNLAREGVEVVHMLRDSNWLAGVAFDTGLTGLGNDHVSIPVFAPATASWTLDFTPAAITADEARVFRATATSGAVVEGLMLQSATAPSGAAATSFRRILTIDLLCDPGTGTYTVATEGSDCGTSEKVGVRAVATVRWVVGSHQREISLEERMMDWR